MFSMLINSERNLLVIKIKYGVEVSEEDISEKEHVYPIDHARKRHDTKYAGAIIIWLKVATIESICFWRQLEQLTTHSECDIAKQRDNGPTAFN